MSDYPCDCGTPCAECAVTPEVCMTADLQDMLDTAERERDAYKQDLMNALDCAAPIEDTDHARLVGIVRDIILERNQLRALQRDCDARHARDDTRIVNLRRELNAARVEIDDAVREVDLRGHMLNTCHDVVDAAVKRAETAESDVKALLGVIAEAVRECSFTTLLVPGTLESKYSRFLFSPEDEDSECTEGKLPEALKAAGVPLSEGAGR